MAMRMMLLTGEGRCMIWLPVLYASNYCIDVALTGSLQDLCAQGRTDIAALRDHQI